MAQEQGKMKDMGALWKRRSAAGKEYLNGKVEIDGKSVDIVIFKNEFKKEDKHPDYRIYESGARKSAAPAQTPKAQPKAAPKQDENVGGAESDDIAF